MITNYQIVIRFLIMYMLFLILLYFYNIYFTWSIFPGTDVIMNDNITAINPKQTTVKYKNAYLIYIIANVYGIFYMYCYA